MKLKQFLAILLILALGTLFSACGAGSAASAVSDQPASGQTVSDALPESSSIPMESSVGRTIDTALAATEKKYDIPSYEEVYISPSFSISSTETVQGEILTVHAVMNSETAAPEISTELGTPVFIPDGEGRYVAFVSVGFAQTPGDYTISVCAGTDEGGNALKTVNFPVSVTAREYGEQHMTISQSTVDSTRGAENANEDYAEKIKSLYPTYDEIKYWTESFLQPVEARVSTAFGLYRYTNGSATPTRHTGIDLAAAAGTLVPASNSGRVVFAGEVFITGNTIVIEHGGGLKTYYFHLNEIDVEKDQMVERGEIIGKVGSTGYSTGAHLHFEVKLGEYALNPWSLFDGTSDIYK